MKIVEGLGEFVFSGSDEGFSNSRLCRMISLIETKYEQDNSRSPLSLCMIQTHCRPGLFVQQCAMVQVDHHKQWAVLAISKTKVPPLSPV